VGSDTDWPNVRPLSQRGLGDPEMEPVVLVFVSLASAALAAAVCTLLRNARLAGLAGVAREVAGGDLGARAVLGGSRGNRELGEAFNEMAYAVETKIQGIEAERDLYAKAVRGMQEGFLVTDRQQKILLANPAAAELLDCDFMRASGTALWEILRNEPVLDAFRGALESGTPKIVQIGPLKERHLTLSFAPYLSGERLVLVIHDSTESARYQELRKEFVANVSHELRTPLTIIRGFVETLEDGGLQDPVRAPEFLGLISKHTRQLTNIVENLLDLSRLESAQALRRKVRVDLGPLLSRVIELQMPPAQKKGQSLRLETARPLPPVQGDPDYLERAVSNLVDNAIKYTPEGGSIRVSAGGDGTSVVVEVTDNGIGIPEADLPRVFERFYRVDKSRSRDMGGTGLGLAIVKHVVQSHGGSIDADSEPGKGTTFRMTLPALAGG
jgi:two-component system phosphate regulon sensor histidine kinase PhoR